MSVTIKGMKIPKCCAGCDAEEYYENSYGDECGFFCPFGDKAYTSETRELKRLDDCPLIPVPPHGRLIDADALCRTLRTLSDNEYTPEVFANWIENYIDTIIPAEEGE